MKQALAKDPKNAEAIANSIVLETIAGKDATQLKTWVVFLTLGIALIDNFISELENTAPNHKFLQDLEEKSSLFDKAATKYSAKVAAA